MNLNKMQQALNVLSSYDGDNQYIKMLKFNVKQNKELTDFNINYILQNYSFKTKTINKLVKIADWYGVQKQKEWQTEFMPKLLLIKDFYGETDTMYHCSIQYRKTINPINCFLPKSAILTNFLVEDYHSINVDFDRYDKLSALRDKNIKLYKHQKDAVKFLLSRKKCILADGMGMGKTKELTVAAIEGNFDSVLIICPASLKINWKKELLWYVKEKDISIIESFQDKTKEELEDFLGYPSKTRKSKTTLLEEAKSKGKWVDNRFVIINYDILDEFYTISKVRKQEEIEKLIENNPLLKYIYNKKSLIIIDEAHKLSNNKSNRFKIIYDLIKRAKPNSIYLATGTPVTNNPQNLFCLLKLIGDPISNDWQYYMKRYCGAKEMVSPKDRTKRNLISETYIHNHGKTNWYALSDYEKDELQSIIRKKCRTMLVMKDAINLEELKERISHVYLRRLKDELEGMPPKFIHEVTYELTDKQRKEYNKLWEEYESAKLAEDSNIELNKELLEGGIYRRYLALEMVEKTVNLTKKILAEEPSCKIVIFCCFDNEIYALKETFGDSAVMYNGKMNLKQKEKAVSDFQNDEKIKVFLGNMASAGVGLTLIRANKLIFNDFDFVSGNNEQAEDRIARIGQKKRCDIYYQFFKDTQYEHMWDIVLKKAYSIEQIIKKESEK